MRLSDAIRLGAMLRPQTTRQYFTEVDGELRSCALGAAIEAAGCSISVRRGQSHMEVWAGEHWPGLEWRVSVKCPDCDFSPMFLLDGIYHLNDRHRWTRERIADWIDTLPRVVGDSAEPMVAEPATEPEPVMPEPVMEPEPAVVCA